jgi:acetyltransferase EpsM
VSARTAGWSPLVLLGAGEHARVVAEAAAASGWNLVGCTGTDMGKGLPMLAGEAPAEALWHAAFVGNPQTFATRRERISALSARGWATIVHPAAVVSPSARIGVGTVILPGAVIHSGALIGDHVVINTGVIVEHDVTVGDFTVLATAAATGGGVRIGSGCYLGLGCRIRDHLTIGDGAVVGMGAVVVKPVRAGATVTGIPAREVDHG